MKLLSQLEKDLSRGEDYSNYIETFNDGVRLQDSMNILYMTEIRTYEIDMSDITDLRKVGEGQFAKVKKGKYHKAGKTTDVALKINKTALNCDTATEFITEENNLRYETDKIRFRFTSNFKTYLAYAYSLISTKL